MRLICGMKKFVSVIISIIYLSLSTDAMVTLHYCGGELESIKLNSETQTCCCGIDWMSTTCCENEWFILDIDIDENIAFSSDISFKNFSNVVYSNLTLDIFIEEDFEDEQLTKYNLPPPKPQPTWLMNSSFIFYG